MTEPPPASPALFYPEANAYAATVMAAAPAVYASMRVDGDLAYGPHPRQRLDVFMPKAPAPLPLLLFIHGGGWMNGQKEWMAFMAPAVAAIPAVFATIDYRLAPGDRWPVLLDDCLTAAAWLTANAARFGADPARLFVGGHSAGAHLAAGVAVRHRRLAGGTIRACLPVSGTFDMHFTNVVPGSMEDRIQRHVFASPADADSASPRGLVDADTPPFLIAHGEHDFPRILKQAGMMAETLAAHGVAHEILRLDGADHFGASISAVAPGAPWLEAAARWIGAVPFSSRATVAHARD